MLFTCLVARGTAGLSLAVNMCKQTNASLCANKCILKGLFRNIIECLQLWRNLKRNREAEEIGGALAAAKSVPYFHTSSRWLLKGLNCATDPQCLLTLMAASTCTHVAQHLMGPRAREHVVLVRLH